MIPGQYVRAKSSLPIAVKDLRAMERAGIKIESIEAVSTAESGLRWTYGSLNGPGVEAWLDSMEAETGEKFAGIVSARAVLDSATLQIAITDDRIYLVDLAIEHYSRGHKQAKDVVMSDVYWTLAGWSD